jgi:hypothetical protein
MDKKTKLLALWACFLNVFDVVATLHVLSQGGIEINPLMASLIETSPVLFAIVKIVVFTLAILFMARHRPQLIKWVVIGYGLLAAWHVCLICWMTFPIIK